MSRLKTILLCALAIAAIAFLAIYEPLTRSTREHVAAARKGLVLRPRSVEGARRSAFPQVSTSLTSNVRATAGSSARNQTIGRILRWSSELLNSAAGLRYFDRIDGKEFKANSDLRDYGLRNPKRTIEFDGEESATLFLGKDAASEERIYVRTSGSRDVYLVSDELLKLAFRDLAEFRDRRLTDLSPDQIDRVIVRRQGGEIELSRDASGWQIVKPLHAFADEQEVEDFLKQLLGQRIVEFVAEDSGDLSVYGIAEGRDEITFYAEGSDRSQTLALGN